MLAQLANNQICDQETEGSTRGWALICSNLWQVIHINVPI